MSTHESVWPAALLVLIVSALVCAIIFAAEIYVHAIKTNPYLVPYAENLHE